MSEKHSFAKNGVRAEREPTEEPNNIEISSGHPGKFDYLPGSAKDSFTNAINVKDPIVLTIVILFVVLCVLLGVCAFAGYWCDVDQPKALNYSSRFPTYNSKKVLNANVTPVTTSTTSTTVRGLGEPSYASELSF